MMETENGMYLGRPYNNEFRQKHFTEKKEVIINSKFLVSLKKIKRELLVAIKTPNMEDIGA